MAHMKDARQVKQIIDIYAEASGQIVNADKSSIFFGKNIKGESKNRILEMLGGMKEIKQSKYLGLPRVIGRSNKQVFIYIKEKIINKLKG